MPRTMKTSTISSSSSSNSSSIASFSLVFPVPCENLTDFIGPDVLAERSTGYLWDSKNVTCLEHAPKLTRAIYLKVIVLTVMSVLSLVGNVATIYSITKNRRWQRGCSAIYTLILHLSVADLLVTIFCLAGEAIWSYYVEWLWGNVACKIFKFLQMFSLYLSTFVLVLIGVDRFVAVRYPMKGLNTSQRCSRFVLFTWLLSLVLATPQIAVFHVAQGPFVEVFTQCVTHGVYTEPWQEQLYASFSLFFMFLLPLAILITTYVSTVVTISRSQRTFKMEPTRTYRDSDLNRRRLIHRAKAKSLRLSVVIVVAFLIWWTPYYTMMIILLFVNPDDHLSEELRNGIFFFGMSNSLVNPLIYGAFHLWPQRQRQGSYHSCRSDASSVQRNNMKRRETKMSLLSHQDSGSKMIAPTHQQHQM
ncbi:gonadotropin-releasing hormone receptor [Temnothorax curvispinosus]|uniref:Gonadotropin-releasing hormone receptor n=1 Tax=Temnothorax curvispinosus TaxID=300111 RepID=A0A6J1R5Y6_9HYME|nr:gonadotropin-releasing hormone receptor [Temnothorax curvispinosus]XP_024890440.1 gonadotropin-releasing hormone receptor [Temnothorax curvispinosus]XP_024890441.1 gonadotropin-releasing hormone receptor [Temnothorax curvispinosus]XP_024890443.1 gonadotropin-releasing hormone receptor [Temnothorax curvispinosus]